MEVRMVRRRRPMRRWVRVDGWAWWRRERMEMVVCQGVVAAMLVGGVC